MGILARIRSWWSPPKVDPNKPHAFRAIDELAAPAATNALSTMGGTQAPIMALTADAARARCRLPGCNRPADDPIHA